MRRSAAVPAAGPPASGRRDAGEPAGETLALLTAIDVAACTVPTLTPETDAYFDRMTSAICEARSTPLSSHCAPALHVHLGCAMLPMRHLEYFFDHARIEAMLFDGFRAPAGGAMSPDLSRPGIGVELKTKDAERFRV